MRKTKTLLSHAGARTTTLFRSDSMASFNVVYEKYWDPLNRFASHYIKDDDTCKEIVQDLFIALYVKRLDLNVTYSLSSYLQASLHNRILNYLRNQTVYKKHVSIAANKHKSTDNDVENSINRFDLERNIDHFISRLPIKYQEVYFLFRQKDMKLKEMALMLNRPVNTVDKQLRKILSLLRSYLRDYK